MLVVPAASQTLANAVGRQVRTLVIDRQPLFLDALSSLLSSPPLLARVATTSSSDVGLDLIRAGGVDLVFCELHAKPIAGLELLQGLDHEAAPPPVILLGDREDDRDLASALASTAAGLFTKDAGLHEFVAGVEAVLHGHRAIGSGLMTLLLERLPQQRITQHQRNKLSPTELEILTMIGRAQSVPTIAATRGISNKTVRNHLAKIYQKLELHGRTEAVLWAARMGL
jgi:DNA-binding NarL/FixJ family response regulator